MRARKTPGRKLVIASALLIATGVILGCVVIAATSSLPAAQNLGAKEARDLIRRVAGSELPSDAVRVKDISPFGSSVVVVAEVETAFRFNRGADGKWRVAEIRTADRRWEDVDLLTRALDREKTARARAELDTLATALEAFRRERGAYVAAKDVAALNDHLNPQYLKGLVRFDPWHRPYRYEGGGASYALRSDGPDGRPDTADDVGKSQ